jgi:heptosyltransferase III
VLVLRPGALGDALLAVPALRALRRSFAPLTLAAHGPTAHLLEALGEIDRGLAFDDPSLAWLFTTDRVPDEPIVAWMNAAIARAAIQAPSQPAGVEHVARYLLRTLAPLGVDLTFNEDPLSVTPLPSDEILIHTGSGSPAKNWPPEKFRAVIRALDAPVRLIVGEADTVVSSDCPRLERPPLLELAGRLAGCRAYLGNDSGVSHLAGLCGARAVTLFGPTNPTVWRPIGPHVQVLPFDASAREVVEALSREPRF